MIDWFASKFGMFVFAAGILALLMFFATFQLGVMSWDIRVRTAEDIARLIDAAGQNSTITYKVDIGSYELNISNQTKAVIIDDKIERHFIADVNSTVINNAAELLINNTGGTVYVT